MIFNIQRYSTHDGPGIRTVIFLKGCSLGCLWCQNPESRSTTTDLLFDQRLCLKDCRLCSTAMPHIFSHQADKLTITRTAIKATDYVDLPTICPSLALTIYGENQTVDQIMQQINKDAAFYNRTGGGITLSGGEPFMQPELSMQILQQCKQQDYHTAVETCLHTPWKNIEPSLPYLDLFLADLKHIDADLFKQWTNGSAKRVLDNLRKLSITNKKMIIRVPLIQGFNADRQSIEQIINFTADETSSNEIHFLPYHTLGMHKYQLMDIPYYAPKEPLQDDELIQFALDYAKQKQLTAVLRG